MHNWIKFLEIVTLRPQLNQQDWTLRTSSGAGSSSEQDWVSIGFFSV